MFDGLKFGVFAPSQKLLVTMIQHCHHACQFLQFLVETVLFSRLCTFEGVVTVGETWECVDGDDQNGDIAGLEQCALLRPLVGKSLTRVTNPRWLRECIPMRGQLGTWTVAIPRRFLQPTDPLTAKLEKTAVQ